MKAIICGGGIGGLTAALALLEHGWDVQVFEQAAALEDIGAGIQISPNACKVLHALKLMPALERLAFKPEALEMRSGHRGWPVFRIPLGQNSEQRWGAPYLHLHRADLVQVLSAALQNLAPNALQTGNTVQHYTQNEENIVAALADGTRVSADVLIAADGVHSRLREQMFGSKPARFTGHVAWRAVVPMSELGTLKPPPTACVWTGHRRHAVTYHLRGGTLANFVGVVETPRWQAESWSEQGSREEALADFANWHPVITQMITAATQHYRWGLFDRPALPRWHDGRAVLLGDSSHPMLPFLAQGAAMAIEDAWALAQELSRPGRSVAVAAQTYFNRRVTRTSQVQKAAQANGRRFHYPAAAYIPIAVLARLAPNLIVRQQDWLYGHDPLQ